MKRISAFIVLVLLGASLLLTGCGAQEPPPDEESPVTLDPIAGTDLNLLTLTEKAAERLGLETAEVVAQEGQVVVPYAALLYDPTGQAWVYVSVEPLVFVRQAVAVETIDGNQVILSEGPDAGSNVVTMGATELFGSESEFEEE